MALRILQLQDSLAIEEIVTREKEVQPDKIFTKHSDLGIVKLGKKRRNRLGTSHRGQTRQQPRQSWRYFCKHATTATTIPITLKIDIRPAGVTLPVRINFGTN